LKDGVGGWRLEGGHESKMGRSSIVAEIQNGPHCSSGHCHSLFTKMVLAKNGSEFDQIRISSHHRGWRIAVDSPRKVECCRTLDSPQGRDRDRDCSWRIEVGRFNKTHGIIVL